MKARMVAFKGKTLGELPAIEGDNFFTGAEYAVPESAATWSITTQGEWDKWWRETLRTEPPGRFPTGAKALVIANRFARDPVAFEPESVLVEDDRVVVSWKRIHMKDDGAGAESRFALLLVPFRELVQHNYRDVTAGEERQREERRIIDEAKVFTEGTSCPVKVSPVLKLRPKPGGGYHVVI